MGLSPGWADPYPWALPDQRLLLTGLDDGVYRLWAAADPGRWFKEANETNNATWVDSASGSTDAAARRRRPRWPGAGCGGLASEPSPELGSTLRHRRTARAGARVSRLPAETPPRSPRPPRAGQRREAETHDPYLISLAFPVITIPPNGVRSRTSDRSDPSGGGNASRE